MNNKKLWIENLPTKRQLWPETDATSLKVGDISIMVGRKIIKLNQYTDDGKIDVLNPSQMDNLILTIISLVISLIVLKLF